MKENDVEVKSKKKNKNRSSCSEGSGNRFHTRLPLFLYDSRVCSTAQLSKTTAAIREKDNI
jgi:hypothetical protein